MKAKLIFSAACAALLIAMPAGSTQGAAGATLITNGFAARHPDVPGVAKSPDWVMTAGSLFALPDGRFWTGIPDGVGSDRTSTRSTNSAVFRMVSARRDYQNTVAHITFNLSRFVTTAKTPQHAWDGVHLMLRYQSQYELYYVSLLRRDGTIVIKKKCPGGPSNGGTYYDLTPYVAYALPLGRDATLTALVENTTGGVHLALYDAQDGLLLAADDTGTGCAPIQHAGGVGVRGDNAEFTFTLSTTPLP